MAGGSFFRRQPNVARHIEASALSDLDALSLQQTPLETAVWLGNRQASARANYAVPWDPSAVRARGHRVANRSRTAP